MMQSLPAVPVNVSPALVPWMRLYPAGQFAAVSAWAVAATATGGASPPGASDPHAAASAHTTKPTRCNPPANLIRPPNQIVREVAETGYAGPMRSLNVIVFTGGTTG